VQQVPLLLVTAGAMAAVFAKMADLPMSAFPVVDTPMADIIANPYIPAPITAAVHMVADITHAPVSV